MCIGVWEPYSSTCSWCYYFTSEFEFFSEGQCHHSYFSTTVIWLFSLGRAKTGASEGITNSKALVPTRNLAFGADQESLGGPRLTGLEQVRSLLWHINKRLPERSYLTILLVTLQSKAQKPAKSPTSKAKSSAIPYSHVRISPFLPMLHARKFCPMPIVLGLRGIASSMAIPP